MRRHLPLTMILSLALSVPGPIAVAFAQSTGPGTHKDGADSTTRQGLGNERSSERTGSSVTTDQGVIARKKHRKTKARSTHKKNAKAGSKTNSTEFREGSGPQSGSTGANSAPATPATP